MSENEFVRGNDKLARTLADPDRATRVQAIREQMRSEDDTYAATLSAIRRAGAQTQAQIAEQLGVTQGAVSQIERQSDMLLSTLRNHLVAAGAERPRLVVTVHGVDIDVAI
ncbi:helix-turn-helix domain-containing protein [Oerskovia enterophila]|uniref:Sigma-70, region 4 n=1 Tax=Oerskovia enterophila TaxID=43678 RepID=A0ABX2Y7X9_9CELL|nr:helix-turn-helix transcriptional regulator [Oerskovia enterophila]OCI32600.1 sigma-70, region 4 [Oerskovia enterophila]